MICDNQVGSAHSFCLVNEKITSLDIKIICYHLHQRHVMDCHQEKNYQEKMKAKLFEKINQSKA